VVTIGAPFDPAHIAHQFGSKLAVIAKQGEAEVHLGGRPFCLRQSFLDDIASANLQPAIAGLKRALLVLHAPMDQVVGIENASQIFLTAKHPKSFVTLDKADHLLSRPEDAENAAAVIAGWLRHYVKLAQPAPPPGAPEGITRVTEADQAGFLQDVTAGPKHHVLADEPLTYGGTDRGMSPYQFLAAGLGACTSMTIRMYARRKGWPLETISVDVTHDKVHAQDSKASVESGAKIDKFTRLIRLNGPLSPDQRDRLRAIADKCPVHRTLEAGNLIETRLADPI